MQSVTQFLFLIFLLLRIKQTQKCKEQPPPHPPASSLSIASLSLARHWLLFYMSGIHDINIKFLFQFLLIREWRWGMDRLNATLTVLLTDSFAQPDPPSSSGWLCPFLWYCSISLAAPLCHLNPEYDHGSRSVPIRWGVVFCLSLKIFLTLYYIYEVSPKEIFKKSPEGSYLKLGLAQLS